MKYDKSIRELLKFDIPIKYDAEESSHELDDAGLYELGLKRLFNVYLTEEAYQYIKHELEYLSGKVNGSLPFLQHMMNLSINKTKTAESIRLLASSHIPIYSGLYASMWMGVCYVSIDYIEYPNYSDPCSPYNDTAILLVPIKANDTIYVPMTRLEKGHIDSEHFNHCQTIIEECPKIGTISRYRSSIYRFYEIIGLLPYIISRSSSDSMYSVSHIPNNIKGVASTMDYSTVDNIRTLLAIFPERLPLMRSILLNEPK